MPPLSIVVINLAEADQLDLILTELKKMMPHNLAEDGLISYQLLRDPTEPRRFIHVEKWASRTAFDTHVASPHVTAWLQATEGKFTKSEVYVVEDFL